MKRANESVDPDLKKPSTLRSVSSALLNPRLSVNMAALVDEVAVLVDVDEVDVAVVLLDGKELAVAPSICEGDEEDDSVLVTELGVARCFCVSSL